MVLVWYKYKNPLVGGFDFNLCAAYCTEELLDIVDGGHFYKISRIYRKAFFLSCFHTNRTSLVTTSLRLP